MNAEDYLTTADAAKVMGVSRVWVWTLIKRKRLKAVRVGSIYLIKPIDLRGYMAKTG